MLRALTLLALLALIPQVAAAEDCLVLVERPFTDVAAEPWMEGIQLVHSAPDYFIAVSSSGEDRLRGVGDVLDCVDSGRGVAAYVQAWSHGADGSATSAAVAEMGEVVFSRDGYWLIRFGGSLPAGFSLDGIRTVTPVRPYRPALEVAEVPSVSSRDPYVTQIVDAVDETRYKATIQGFQDLVTRNARTTNFETACDDAAAVFSGLGLDTEIQTYVTEPWYGSPFTCWNVIGEKVGTEFPDQIYIICGHLDSTAGSPWNAESVAPGADDNASGSSIVLEAARVMEGFDYRYTVRYICFGAEEQGLCGSTYYAGLMGGAGEDIRGVINIDMVLYGSTDILRVSYDTQSSNLAQAIGSAASTYVPELDVELNYNPGAAYSDHYPFWQNGYPAVQGSERNIGGNPYYHTTQDLLENYLQYFPFPTNCTKAAVAALASLAEPVVSTSVWPEPASTEDARLSFRLQPNPARGSTAIVFDAPSAALSTWGVYDVLGRCGAGSASPGGGTSSGTVVVSLEGVPSGTYWVRVGTEASEQVRQLTVIR